MKFEFTKYLVVCPDGFSNYDAVDSLEDAEYMADIANKGHDEACCNGAHRVCILTGSVEIPQ